MGRFKMLGAFNLTDDALWCTRSFGDMHQERQKPQTVHRGVARFSNLKVLFLEPLLVLIAGSIA